MQALDLITEALRAIGVIGETETPSAEQGSSALSSLNRLMASLAEDGIDLGYSPIDDTTADVAIPLGHVGAIEALLGQIEASSYGVEIPPVVAGVAANGYSRLLGQAVSMQIRSAVSNTLPAGKHHPGGFDIVAGYS